MLRFYAAMRFMQMISCSLHKSSYLFTPSLQPDHSLISSRWSVPLSKDTTDWYHKGGKSQQDRPNSPTLGLTNSSRTQLPSGFLQYLSVLDTEQKGKTDLLNVKVEHHRIWKPGDSQESESEKKAKGVGFQLSSWTESNLPSEPLLMNKHSKSSASYLTNKPPSLQWSHPSLLILDSLVIYTCHHSLPLGQLVFHTAQVQRPTVLFLLLDSAFYSTSVLTKFLSQENRVANYTTLYILSLSTKMKGSAKPGVMVYTCNSST